MTTRQEIYQAYDEASLALKKLMELVELGLPAEMTDPEDEDAFCEAYNIASILLPMYMDDDYIEVEMYTEGLMNK